jgi:lipopolysaccharide export system protein LptC
MIDNVGLPAPTKSSAMITSTRMTVFPQKQYAQTEQAVRIDGAGGTTTGE